MTFDLAGDEGMDEDGEDAEDKLPSCMDYVMHFLTIFWKVMFAFVPPTGKCHDVQHFACIAIEKTQKLHVWQLPVAYTFQDHFITL